MGLNKNLKIWQRIILSLCCIFLGVGFFMYGMTYNLDFISQPTYKGIIPVPFPLVLSALFFVTHFMVWKEYIKNHTFQKKWKLWVVFIICTKIIFLIFFYLEIFIWLIVIKKMSINTILSRL